MSYSHRVVAASIGALILTRLAAGGVEARSLIRVGTEFQVNAYTRYHQLRAAAAMREDGSFVVVWQSPQDGDAQGVFGRRFDSAGVPQAQEFLVNAVTVDSQSYPSIAMNGDGSFVAWEHRHFQNDYAILARRFDSSAAPQGSELV